MADGDGGSSSNGAIIKRITTNKTGQSMARATAIASTHTYNQTYKCRINNGTMAQKHQHTKPITKILFREFRNKFLLRDGNGEQAKAQKKTCACTTHIQSSVHCANGKVKYTSRE